MSSHVHIINKADVAVHKVIPYESSSVSLPDGAVKARSKLLSITLTNLAYARMGSILHWWDAFPVPQDLPVPYNNREEWGIVSSWGYGEVLESRNEKIPAGTLMYGYWPTSTHPVVLNFKSSGVDGHFNEVSPDRQRLMTVYNHFLTVPEKVLGDKQAWNSGVMTLWAAGHFLAKYTFPAADKKAISPNGATPWTQTDGDLRSTLVVNLVASGKTARGFTWQLTQRSSPEENAPLALLEVSSTPEKLPTATSTKIDVKGVKYDAIASQDTLAWIERFSTRRIVMVDFGAPEGTAQGFHDAIKQKISNLKFDYIFAVQTSFASDDKRTASHLFNTSPLMDVAVETEGLDSVYGGRAAAFKEWLAAKGQGDMELKWGEGIQGKDGIEGAWKLLNKGDLPRNKALVFKV